MSRTLRYEMAYDAPVAAVAAMVADPAFRREVCEAQRVLRHDVAIEHDGDTMKVRIESTYATDGVPAVAAKIVGSETTAIQSETWTRPEHGDVSIEIPGKPGTIGGTAVIEGTGDTCVETVELGIKVSIPLVGGKLESLLHDILLRALKAEYSVGQKYLAR